MMNKQSLPQRISKSIAIVALSLFLASCFGGGVEKVFADYQTRIERLSDVAPVPEELPNFPLQPGISDVRQDIPEGNIGLLASMRLNRCRAGQLIAQRNSSMGRVQSVQARVLYEIEMIPALKECLQLPEVAESNMAATLELALAEKIEHLPLWIDRFWSSEPAVRDTFRPARDTLSVKESTNIAEVIAALNYFTTLFTEVQATPEQNHVNKGEWQLHMQTLGTSRAIPELLRTQQHVVAWLAALNQQLSGAAEALGCSANMPEQYRPQNAEYMQNILNSMWIEQLQPALARWDRYQRQINSVLPQILAQVSASEWHSYLIEISDEQSLAAKNRILAREHAERWQEFLASCQLEVTPAT
ncbi:hypothetical protein CWE08_03620 [Aliidiomarina iranensis]|uniref:DUF3080 domain-containing protein n=1 Tax=Aliidiomarina iranensis TaxID=1434071 RepID=A0A432VZX4_9GAMM|nr:DUF3080 family protein [Aliidiomarina iranensis]RUO22288.1 hypothetical protein CWE08_03620 [Aliidiomarina iranensis]